VLTFWSPSFSHAVRSSFTQGSHAVHDPHALGRYNLSVDPDTKERA